MNPYTDGLPPCAPTSKAPCGEDVFLLGGIENATRMVRGGKRLTPHLYTYCRNLIAHAKALEEALDHRERVQGINREDDAA